MSTGARILVTGATGMIGGLVVRQALERPDVAGVTTLGRRPIGRQHPKLAEVVHEDFADFSSAGTALAGYDAAVFCLGAYTGSVPDEEFERITVDYTVAFGEAFRAASPTGALSFLSGQGADPGERSRVAFARYKGMAENALLAMGFPRLRIFRPGYIHPDEPRREPNLAYAAFRLAYPVVRRIYPNVGIGSTDLARAMLHAALEGTPGHDDPILENQDIRDLAARLGG